MNCVTKIKELCNISSKTEAQCEAYFLHHVAVTDYSNLELSDIYNLYEIYAKQYNRMVSVDATHQREFEQIKERIESFQLEIEKRMTKENTEKTNLSNECRPGQPSQLTVVP